MIKLSFKMTRKAKGRGGDRYEAPIEGEDRPVVVYLPQAITRPKGGEPTSKLVVSIDNG